MENDNPTVTAAPEGPSLVQIADRVLGRPLLIHPTKAEVILHVLDGRLPINGNLAPLGPEASRFVGSSIDEKGRSRTYRTDGGVAIISVIGSLVNRGAWIGSYSGMTSYEGLAKQVSDAAADPKVHAIMLDMDSPGGEATGMFTLAAKVREAAQVKTVVTVVNDMAASAAYGIASQGTEIVVSSTSIVGSIGVVLTHFDRSGDMEKRGIKPTLIYAGSHKVDGHPFGPLSDAVRGDLQAEVGKFYDQFVSLVAQGRGDRLTEQDARATEARTFLGQEAIDRGLADRVASFDAVLASLQSKPPRVSGQSKKGVRAMDPNENAPTAGITQQAHDAAVSAARAEGTTAGATAERERIASIMGHEAAKGRQKQALAIALDAEFAGLSADAVGKLLASSPVEGSAPQSQTPTISERANAEAEIGATSEDRVGASEKVKSGWSAAIGDANKMMGATG